MRRWVWIAVYVLVGTFIEAVLKIPDIQPTWKRMIHDGFMAVLAIMLYSVVDGRKEDRT